MIIESTGTYDFKSFLNDLQDKYNVKLIKIFAEPDICLKRVKMRDQSLHVNVSDDIVIDINKKAFLVKLDFDLEIYNVNLNDNEIVRKISLLPKLID